MKIALVADTHYGIRNDNITFLDNNKRFLDNVFFPYLKEHTITNIVHFGDLVDRRKYINYYTAQRLRKDFIEPIISNYYNFYWILGNHDIFYRHSNEISAASELLNMKNNPHIRKIYSPTHFLFNGFKILMVPWIHNENREECYKAIEETDAKVLFGHLELQGFEIQKGVIQNHGDSREAFNNFDLVISGHYHHKSSSGNIHYLGAFAEYTWGDWGGLRGFHIFDTDSREIEFIQNPYNIFEKVYYNDSDETRGCTPPNGFESYQGKIIKVIVNHLSNQEQFDWFINKIEEANPIQLQIIRDNLYFNLETTDIVTEQKDTLTVIRDVIKAVNTAVNATKLDDLFSDLYREAQDVN